MNRYLVRFNIAAFVILLSCSGPEKEKITQTVSNSPSTQPGLYYVNDAENRELGSILLTAEPEISLGEKRVYSRRSNDKRKYIDSGGQTLYEVKFSDDGFKVRNAAGEMLWKVKIRDNKIQIGNTEEMENPFELRPGAGSSARAMLGEEVLAELETGGIISPVKLSGKLGEFWIAGPDPRYESLVLQLEAIEPMIRYIILTEILSAR
jgi:hypothetical protein